MLYDAYGCSAVELADTHTLEVRLIGDNPYSAMTEVCSGPYDAAAGGFCSAVIPLGMFNRAVSVPAEVALVIKQNGAIVGSGSASTVLAGAPGISIAQSGSATVFGPYRYLHAGEEVQVPIFADTGGEDIESFSLQLNFDSALFTVSGSVVFGAGWKVCFSHSVPAQDKCAASSRQLVWLHRPDELR